ncbi:energy transducer TonB [Candidatus Cetobacterium colombiensis]|uniref:TonB family protein n=1 Tax=Candidatus Cetobacterium colombiensis TaxID=3073100 RepID=A0ABU4WB51_9FUSO|nr:TonB family protein [Candidatus Cetobacterium colombiensis]MDX8336777.1 TonB family protein [Candidatus Cetobacterium colombiensis]
MNKFYILSAILHGIIIFVLFGFSKDEELKFKEKNTMIVSIKARKAISNNVEINSKIESFEEKNLEDIKEEKIEKKVEKKEIINEIKKTTKKLDQSSKKKLEVKKQKINSSNSKKEIYNEFKDQNRFLKGEDGIFTAVSLDGIEYEIIKEIDPQYPIKARKIGYNGTGVVKVNFLVDVDGSIQDIKFIAGETKFGFKEEVEKSLKKWKFKPILYKGKKIRVHFEKEFKFKKN